MEVPLEGDGGDVLAVSRIILLGIMLELCSWPF